MASIQLKRRAMLAKVILEGTKVEVNKPAITPLCSLRMNVTTSKADVEASFLQRRSALQVVSGRVLFLASG